MFMVLTLVALSAIEEIHGDAAAGAVLYAQRCAMCHGAAGKGGGQGPAIVNAFGNRAGSSQFPYSRALLAAAGRGLVWNGTNLDQFLAAPNKLVPGTIMSFRTRGVKQRADIIAYLQALTSPPWPTAE